jgi:hypothetical protein
MPGMTSKERERCYAPPDPRAAGSRKRAGNIQGTVDASTYGTAPTFQFTVVHVVVAG